MFYLPGSLATFWCVVAEGSRDQQGEGTEAPRASEGGGDSDAGVRFESVRLRQAELRAAQIDGRDCGGRSHRRRWSRLPEV